MSCQKKSRGSSHTEINLFFAYLPVLQRGHSVKGPECVDKSSAVRETVPDSDRIDTFVSFEKIETRFFCPVVGEIFAEGFLHILSEKGRKIADRIMFA